MNILIDLCHIFYMTSSIYLTNNIYNTNLLLTFISYDSLIYSIIFFLNILNNNIQNKSILNFFTNTPQLPFLKRYIYYLIASLSNQIVKILLWDQYNKPIISFLYLFSAYPLVLNKVIALKPINTIVNYYYTQIYNILKFLSSYIISSVLNIICSETIKKPVNISANEILQIFSNMNGDNMLDIGKILFISIIVYYMEYEQKNKINTKILSFLYNRKYILDLKDDYFKEDIYKKIKDPKEKLEQIINTRRWDLCFHPRIFKLLIHVSTQSKDGNIIKIIWSYITYFEYYIMKLLSSYALLSFFKTSFLSTKYNNVIPYILLAVLSSIVKLYENDKLIIGICFRFISIGHYYFSNNDLVSCLICECLEMLYNKHTFKIYNIILEKYRYHYQIFAHNYHILYDLFINIILINYISKILDPILFALLIVSNLNNYTFIWYLTIGYISNYDIYHLVSIGLVYYIGFNIIDYINGGYKIDKFNIDLIKSYITNSNKKQEEKLDNSIYIIDNYLK